jgi:tellurite resistance protein TerA
MNLKRGQKVKLTDSLDVTRSFSVEIGITGDTEYDFSCFGLDADGRCSREEYFVFYNNLACPDAGVTLRAAENPAVFDVTLAALPSFIAKLGFVATIDGNSTMGQIASGHVIVSQDGVEIWRLPLDAGDFDRQKAIIAVEIYQKAGVWRLCAVANGFDGGLSDLLAFYGVEEAKENATPPTPPQPPKPDTPRVETTITATTPASERRQNKSEVIAADDDDYYPRSNDDWV